MRNVGDYVLVPWGRYGSQVAVITGRGRDGSVRGRKYLRNSGRWTQSMRLDWIVRGVTPDELAKLHIQPWKGQ